MKRIPLPDLLKGFAVLFMVQVHIMELFIDTAGRENLSGKISLFLGGPFAAPVFMIVMGYFVSRSKKNTIQTILRGIELLILGLLLNIGLNFHLLLIIKYEGRQFDPLEYDFGIDILHLAGLSIVILAFLKRLNKWQFFITGFLILIIPLLTPLMNRICSVGEKNFILPFIAGNYSWSYFPLFPWLVYPVSGFWFQKSETGIFEFYRKNPKLSITFLIIVFVSLVFFFRYGVNSSVNLSAYYHHNVYFFLWAGGLIIFWVIKLRQLTIIYIDSQILGFLRWIGKNVTLVYVIQWIIIGNITTSVYQTQPLSRFGGWFAGILIVTLVIARLFEKFIKSNQKFKIF